MKISVENSVGRRAQVARRNAVLSTAAAAAVLSLGLSSLPAAAQTITNFQVASGAWVDPLSWDNGVPQDTYVANVNNANNATVGAGDAAVADFLHVGLLPGNSGTVTISGGTLTLGEARIGGREVLPDTSPNAGGTGSVVQTGGTVSVTGAAGLGVQSLFLGDGGLATANTANGTYNISGGTLIGGLVDNDAIVVGTGVGSVGTFIQSSNSTVRSPGFVLVGRRGATGTYTMSGGTLEVAIGAPFSSAATASRFLWVGDGDAAFSTATNGTFTQTDGSVTVGDAAIDATQSVEIGRRSATGLYDISGGTLSVPNGGIVVGGGGQTADVASQMGRGTLRVSGTAAITVGDSQTDGGTPGNNGNRGNMSIGSANVAGATTTGLVDMSGGTFTFTDPNGIVAVGNGLGATGTLDVSGGTFNVDGAAALLDVGRTSSAGLLEVSGTGTVNVNQLTINSSSPTSGSVTREVRVEGGTLNVAFWEMGSQTPTSVTRVFNQSGGDVNVTSASAFHRAGRAISYNLSGGTFDFAGNFPLDTSTFNVSGTNVASFAGAYRTGAGTTNVSGGTLNLTNVNDGTANQGGIWNVSGGTLNATGTFNVTVASPTAGPGTLNLTGGTGTIANLVTGGVVAGSTVYISGGTHTITNLTISDNGILRTDNTVAKDSTVTLGTATVNTNSGSLTLSGPVGGNSLTKIGTGTLVLTGNNTYSGGTTVTTGTLSGNTSGIQGNVTNNALVVFDQSTSGAYAGSMSGSGAVTKSGTGTVSFTGSNSYSGVTTVTGGALQVNTAAAAPLLTGPGGTDIQFGRVIFDGGDAAAIRSLLVTSYNGGINPFQAGQIRSTTIAPNRALGYADNGTNVTVMYTVNGDANLSGGVSIADLNVAKANFGGNDDVWTTGDFNYDGNTTIADINVTKANFGVNLPLMAGDSSSRSAALQADGSAGPDQIELVVNIATGQVQMKGNDADPGEITSYEVRSVSGSMNVLAGGYNSLADQARPGWGELPGTQFLVGEDHGFTSDTVNLAGFTLGNLFAVGGTQDLAFNYGNENFLTVAGIVTYVPEPTGVTLLGLGALGLLGRRRRRV